MGGNCLMKTRCFSQLVHLRKELHQFLGIFNFIFNIDVSFY